MNQTEKTNKPASAFLAVIATCAGVWYYFGGGLEQQAQSTMARIERQVATDAEAEYNMAKRSGTAIDAYVHAGLVAAAYLQAGDEVNYQRWKRIEAAEASRAGM